MHGVRRASALVAVLTACTFAQAAAAAKQPLQGARVVAPAAIRGSLLGPVAPTVQMDLTISLRGRHQNEIDGLIARQNAPGNPFYLHYLTPQQYGNYFGAAPLDYANAIRSLREHGFTIDEPYENRIDLAVHAPASVVEAYFGTPVDLREEGGRVFFSNRYAPQIPAGVAIASVAGLDDYFLLQSHHEHRGLPAAAPNLKGWTPPNIQSVYDLTPVYKRWTGAGLTVIDATVGTVRPSDFTAFTRQFKLKATLSQIALKGAKIDNDGESTLDVEWMAAIAPRSKVLLVSATNSTSSSFIAMHTYIVNKLSSNHIVSTSWGGCERSYDYYGAIDQEDRLFAQAETQGQFWMAAAGDWGSDDCELTYHPVPAVDFPGSSTHVMSVGGTRVIPSSIIGNSYQGWGSEVVWNDQGYGASAGGIGAGGGGNSIYFRRPTFQDGATNAFMRQVPDVVLMADLDDLHGYNIYFKGGWQSDWGGTSFAAPEWAGFLTLVQSRYGKQPMPSPLYKLYALFESPAGANLFHNIVRGCNAYVGTPGFCAAHGYTPVGGLGSFVGSQLQYAY